MKKLKVKTVVSGLAILGTCIAGGVFATKKYSK